MLTDKERKWLKQRDRNLFSFGLYLAFTPGMSPALIDYRDAAEFEARVQRALMYQYEKAYHCKDVSGGFMPDRDTMLMYARLAVEQEMDQ